MYKKCFFIIFFTALHFFCYSQSSKQSYEVNTKKLDSLNKQLLLAKSDSHRIMVMQNIAFFYERLVIDSSLKYFNAGLDLAREKRYAWGEARLLAGLSGLMENQGKIAEAFELLSRSLKIAEENNLAYDIARGNRRISGVYTELKDYPKAISHLLKALQKDEESRFPDKVAIDHYALADAYEKIDKLDSASFHINIALKQKDHLKGLMQSVYAIDGHIKQKNKNYEQAAISYKKGFDEAQIFSDLIGSSGLCADLAGLYMETQLRDSAIFFATKGFNYGNEISFQRGIMRNGYLLAELYDSSAPALALKYFKIAVDVENTLFGVNNFRTIQDLLEREDAKRKELEDAEKSYRNRLRLISLLIGLGVLFIVSFILYRNNRHKQKANVLLQQQKQKVETTLYELKATQAQLIQSEKMASLGELTAGIAHEIQNPLNFVNNFSEVNTELIEELKEEAKAGNTDEVLAIASDLNDNMLKISHHGKRADAIVKGMLQHSRKTNDKKEPTDINALADEYIRLSYHGFRAKEKTFNATIKTNFDESIGNIEVIPQDIGRVLLNLLNNAFYAVNERQKACQAEPVEANPLYEPMVTVSTKKINNKIEIRVSDNGYGIPQKILDKIYQPFFTTKPTGEGTGLGLSLSYDIIKAHGGEMRVETKEGEGAEFIIQLQKDIL